MRRSIVAAAAVAGLIVTAGPATASPFSGAATPSVSALSATAGDAQDGWEPVNYQPYDIPAGLRCDFAVHADPIVDEVRYKVLETYPDGSPKREVYTGDLIMRFTNKETGVTADSGASGDAVIDYFQDGSMIWYVKGPVSVGFGENGGNLPRGIWRVDGHFTIEFAPDGYRTLTMREGTTHNVCTDLD